MSRTISRALGAALLASAAVIAGCGSGSSAPKNLNATIKIVNAKPAGGEQTLDVKKGGKIHLVVQSDTADEIHIHGYDFHKDVARNSSVTFDFPAKIDGQFIIELEAAKQEIAKLKVEP
ncbi:MAG: hypothetical protein QOE11_2043 [Solirubrobacteraceae bacterium]|jgi:hypothetical protein|nr:hypothetical protein [Solirubrobacteraceae bacterium]